MVKNAEEKNHVECTDFGTACQQKVLVESRHLAVKDSVSQIKTTFPWQIHGIPKLGRLSWIRLSRDPHALLPILCQSGPVCCPYVMIQGNNRFGSMTLRRETEEAIPSPDIENTLAAQVGHLHGTPLIMEDLLTLAARSYESIQIYAVPPKSDFINSLGDFGISHVCRVTGTRSAWCVFLHVCMHWVLAFCEYAFFICDPKDQAWRRPDCGTVQAISGARSQSVSSAQAYCTHRLFIPPSRTIVHAPVLHPRTISPRHSAAQLDRAGHADKSIAWPHPAAPP